MVTVFQGTKFDDAEEVTDADFPAIPRVGETVSVSNDPAASEKVTAVDYQVDRGRALARILLAPKSRYSMDNV
jgi:hypothetical protein